MTLRQPARRRVHDDVVEIVREAILDGTLAPGSRLRVEDLAQRLDVSPMPVREALSRLEASGLVTAMPHRGAWVTRLDAREIGQLYEVRLILEPEAARRAALVIPQQPETRIEERLRSLQRTVAEGELPRVLDADEKLLAEVYAAPGNEELVRQIKELWTRVRPYKILHAVTSYATTLPPVYEWATELVAACLAGDSERAFRLTRDQLEGARSELMEFVDGSDPAAATSAIRSSFDRSASGHDE